MHRTGYLLYEYVPPAESSRLQDLSAELSRVRALIAQARAGSVDDPQGAGVFYLGRVDVAVAAQAISPGVTTVDATDLRLLEAKTANEAAEVAPGVSLHRVAPRCQRFGCGAERFECGRSDLSTLSRIPGGWTHRGGQPPISLLMQTRRFVLIVACLLLACHVAAAQGLTIAAASDLQSVLPVIVPQFEKDTGQHVRLTFGSSGNFFTQIQNGAPFDVFLSADIDYPKRLDASGQAERGSLYEYATGRIVLWTRKDSGVDLSRGLTVLADGRVRRIAIANPEHAPYGRAAVAALRHERLYEQVQGKFVLGENISQAAQFVQTGSADVGVLALSLSLSPTLKRSGTYVDIPESWYPPIEQAAVVVASSRQKALARQFIDYLKKPDTVRILQSYGFAVPRTTTR